MQIPRFTLCNDNGSCVDEMCEGSMNILMKGGDGTVFTPRHACAARGQVIALGLEYIFKFCKFLKPKKLTFRSSF